MRNDTTFPSRGLRTKADRQVERLLPNDRLGKDRLLVCPRGQIADVLEPLATPALADRGGADAEAGEGGVIERGAWEVRPVRHSRKFPAAPKSPNIATDDSIYRPALWKVY